MTQQNHDLYAPSENPQSVGMTSWQRAAIRNHCRLACETLNPRLHRWITNGVSLTLSVNSGYE